MKRCYSLLSMALAFLLLSSAPTQAQGELNVFLVASSDVMGAGDALDYTLMVSNTGTTTLNNVNLDVQLPEQITRFFSTAVIGRGLFNCTVCDPGDLVVWEVGTLAPGANLRLTYFTRIADSAPPSDATTTIVASADNISDIILMHDVVVDPSPLLRPSLVPGPGPAIPGEPFTYTFTYGNIGATSPTEVVLTIPVPDGASFQSATDGGMESEGVVTWSLGTVGVGAGGRVEMTVVPDASLTPGTTLEAEAALDSGVATELVVRSEAVTEVGSRGALRFDYGVSQNAVGRSGSLYRTFTAANTSTTDDLTGVAVILRLPQQVARFFTSDVIGSGLGCTGPVCDPEQTIAWEVGTLAPGQGRTIIVPTSIADDAQQGEVLRAFYLATADGLEDQIGGGDLVVDPSPVARIQVIPDPGPAIPGESFTYTILLSNIGFQQTDFVLQMTLPEGTTFSSATGGGLRWTAL